MLTLPAFASKGRVLPVEGVRQLDAATEFPVERLTDPKFSSYWPYPYVRAIARKGAFFLFSSDRDSGTQAYRYELKSGEIKQLTEATNLRTSSLQLMPDDHMFAYIDGQSLFLSHLSTLKEREVYRIPDGWEAGEGLCLAGDGVNAALIEKQGDKSRLRLIGVARGNATTVVEHDGILSHPQPRPRRGSVLFQCDGEIQLVNYDGQNRIKLSKIAPSEGAAVWSNDGRYVDYLQLNDRNQITMREVVPDSRQDRIVAPTSQYSNFSRNTDSSVFVAASRSLASPYILVMIRSVRRELTLCEHKSSTPARVAPVFSPTSQRIYFESDKHGKPAIYSVVVDKFIEKTESEDDKQG